MAEPPKKGVDPFEAFKKKKAAAQQVDKQVAAMDEANKKFGWIDGIGPADEKVDPLKPKGFTRGRYVKPPVNAAEIAKMKPADYDETRLAKPKPTDVDKLPPVDKRRPKKFGKF